MYSKLRHYLEVLTTQFDRIPDDRKTLLSTIGNYISEKHSRGDVVQLVYICTHNSRRSHFGQIWAKLVAGFYELPNIHTYSGGTVASALNTNVISALDQAGVVMRKVSDSDNPVYQFFGSDDTSAGTCFSKRYDHPENPQNAFAAIMTCSEADTNCPHIPGAELRIGLPYEDPGSFDHTSLESQKYANCCLQVALETLYAFSFVK